MKTVALLLRLLDESYEKKAWQGPNLRGSLRAVTAGQAAWRPAPGRPQHLGAHLHAAVLEVRRGADADGRETRVISREGEQLVRAAGLADRRVWRADLALLDAQHRRLRAAVAKLRRGPLRGKPRGSKYKTDTLVYGVASHDVYHTGQIQMLKRLWKDRKKSR